MEVKKKLILRTKINVRNAAKWKHLSGGTLSQKDKNSLNKSESIESKVSTAIMNLAWIGKLKANLPLDTDLVRDGGVPQRTYLLGREELRKEFLNAGYIEGKEGDYGLVRKAVGDRNIPIYQREPDAAKREDLVPIGNIDNKYYPKKGELIHAGNYPTALYYNCQNNKLYLKAWDLNDYGGNTGYAKKYNFLQKLGANILDKIGSPTVVTSGFLEIPEDVFYYHYNKLLPYLKNFYKSKGLEYDFLVDPYKNTPTPHLPEIVITNKLKKYAGGGYIKENNNYINGYVRLKNNHPISFDTEGNLIDLVTGEKGTMMLPGFTVTGISPETRAKNYSTSFDGTYGLTPRDIYGMMPVVGDALDIKDIGTDLYNGNYVNAGIGAGLFLLPNVVERPLKAAGRFLLNKGKKAYNTTKDLLWLTKTYNNVGTGLKNPYVRNKFLDLAKSPSTSRSFIEKYTINKEAGLNLSLIKEALPLLENLLKEFGIVPEANFKDYYTVSDLIGEIKNGLLYAKNLSTRYNQELEFLKNNNEILYNIAKESPQYQLLIVNDLKNGNIGNIEDYVKNLIKLSNTFLRRMNLKSDLDFTDAFSTIRGRSLGRNEFAMDVGNAEVVFDPIWSRGYGNTVATYTPKELKLEGPIETWWSLRKPNFKDESISIDPKGMHTNSASIINESITAERNANRYLQSMNIPNSYNRRASHMIFLSPNEGASISDLFTITPGYLKDLKYTLGYKKGGKIDIMSKKQYKIGISIGINTYGFKNN